MPRHPLLLVLVTSWLATANGAGAADDPECMALSLYWEAKGEDRSGMDAVGWVILNRMAHPEFPDAVCAVVKEGGEQPPCQFAWWCDGESDTPTDEAQWRLALEVTDQLLDAPPPDPTDGALFFHDAAIEPPWPDRERSAEIGTHIFYR